MPTWSSRCIGHQKEWLGFTAAVRGDGNGDGQADATLFDHRGRIGRALKSLLVDTR